MEIKNIDFEKNPDKLIPAIIQDDQTRKVLMLGYMNKEAWEETLKSKKVTFYSRSKKRLWTKGEESGNFLNFVHARVDCDEDTLLIQVSPSGPACHKGTDTCWGEENVSEFGFIKTLEGIIRKREEDIDRKSSYVSELFRSGINKIAQKVGEEAVETVIAAKDDAKKPFLDESADLFFHWLVLLRAKDTSFSEVLEVLKARHR